MRVTPLEMDEPVEDWQTWIQDQHCPTLCMWTDRVVVQKRRPYLYSTRLVVSPVCTCEQCSAYLGIPISEWDRPSPDRTANMTRSICLRVMGVIESFGWELVGTQPNTYYFKRPADWSPEEAECYKGTYIDATYGRGVSFTCFSSTLLCTGSSFL